MTQVSTWKHDIKVQYLTILRLPVTILVTAFNYPIKLTNVFLIFKNKFGILWYSFMAYFYTTLVSNPLAVQPTIFIPTVYNKISLKFLLLSKAYKFYLDFLACKYLATNIQFAIWKCFIFLTTCAFQQFLLHFTISF